ncbi:virulence associated protein B [Candidatus Vecturithrix granuli]|uniref:Virulence associated protein B n=1 Tax=Vecturithrix granuli TaxID=1499967 RepID=A0A0S6W5L3_VECG1|nr:virulence associated protein B [Candidatus Vecturithrix granuli]
MQPATIIREATGQTVRLPKDCELPGQRVYIKKVGNVLVLIPEDNPWQTLFDSLDLFTNDYMEGGR